MVHKITLKPLFSFLAFGLFFVGFGFGQSIFNNPITENAINAEVNNPYTNGQYFDPSITVSGIGKGTGVSGIATGTNDRYNVRGWSTGSIDANDYFEFTITPNAGYEIDFGNFVYTSQASAGGPTLFAFRSSLDGYTSNIGTPSSGGTTINLTPYQNITSPITFRFYAWGAGAGTGTFSIDSFTFSGVVSALPCSTTVTWNGAWSGVPNSTTEVIIAADYNTSNGGSEISFSACNLTINPGAELFVANGTYVEVVNDVVVDGELYVETQGNFVQSSNYGTFTLSPGGDSRVVKQTANKAQWYYYTYWSSPVNGQTIEETFPDVDGDRRFWYNAANYIDEHTVGTTNGIPDDIDDNNNDWQIALGTDPVLPGVGYAVTESRFHFPGATGIATFIGEFNTGDIPITIINNTENIFPAFSWNFIGNPYPSAIDFITFQQANSSVIDGAAYFWSQASPPDAANPGNQNLNFNLNDYAVFTVGSGGTAGGGPDTPTQYIPSGQGFFVAGLANGTATFTNAMRMADGTSNLQFFKNTSAKNSSNVVENKLWVDLKSDNGIFNQILVAYVDGATNDNDGLSYDAPKLLTADYPAALYSIIESSTQKFAIQGKAESSLDANETIKLGFKTSINVATLYTLSIAQLQGEFLKNNTIYLKDNLLNKVHNLCGSDYTFTSEVGEFNDRFVVMFNNQSLSIDELVADTNTLKIIDLDNDRVKFTITNDLRIKTVTVFDLLGRELYAFKGQNSEEIYHLSNLKNNIYIAKVELSNGSVITKKAVKK
ncbi:T9SS type A sorting domain-containing protein [Confluentibacter lentus]|uniref:T9SS type A sorting domain-containing protein n=1 Tax=Confluentibacter lentus TaxID=1699412 RepID=UPI000C284D8C|nr:T9SS type A sorting domain-containing protein [Confluentibacter lentus]